ncbi:Hypothetical protein SMAX5B_017553 [Scophthalmus maximus]|uniref:Uncharacterized protein n=1 Tax=Scophthalmus maximus TaxID=52904 RepID=A0A2U9AVW9_SCOMX|nr:Hypothetical protein SMAX5B_017553 [Scophthalmus maximus]
MCLHGAVRIAQKKIHAHVYIRRPMWRSTVSLTLRRTVEHLRRPLQPDQGARRPRREEHVIK